MMSTILLSFRKWIFPSGKISRIPDVNTIEILEAFVVAAAVVVVVVVLSNYEKTISSFNK